MIFEQSSRRREYIPLFIRCGLLTVLADEVDMAISPTRATVRRCAAGYIPLGRIRTLRHPSKITTVNGDASRAAYLSGKGTVGVTTNTLDWVTA